MRALTDIFNSELLINLHGNIFMTTEIFLFVAVEQMMRLEAELNTLLSHLF